MSANKEEKVVAEDTNVEMSDATSPKKQCSPSKKQTDVATQAIMHLAQGKRNLIVQDIKSAVESLEKACSMFAEEFGETADECGESYYCYGSALLELARLETGVIGVGEGESTETSEDEQGDSEEDKEKEESKENECEPKTNGHAASKPEESKDKAEADKEEIKDDDAEMEETDEDKENDEPAEDGNDEEVEADPAEEEEIPNLQLAWEVLELAKNIFYRQSKTSIDMENKLSETYLKLGEVSLESENYVQSIEDLCQCLFIRQKNLPSDDRKIAEVHYQLGNSYSFDKQYMKGKFQYDLSLKVLNERIDKLKEAIAARIDGKQAPVSEKADAFYTEEGEIEEIQKILPEIAEKIADMEDLEKEVKVSAAVSPGLVKAIRNTAQAVSSLATEMRDTAQAKMLEFGEGSSSGGSGSSKVENEAFAAPTKTSPTAAKSAVKDISHLVKRKVPKPTSSERESTNSEGDSPKAKAAAVVVEKSPTVKKVKVLEEPVLTNGTTNGTTVNGSADKA